MNELGNIVSGNIITVQSYNLISKDDKKLIATVGISDLAIVDTENVTLVCQKDAISDIKKVIEDL